jgi:hypothetical protein
MGMLVGMFACTAVMFMSVMQVVVPVRMSVSNSRVHVHVGMSITDN